MAWSNESKNTASYSNESKNTASWNTMLTLLRENEYRLLQENGHFILLESSSSGAPDKYVPTWANISKS